VSAETTMLIATRQPVGTANHITAYADALLYDTCGRSTSPYSAAYDSGCWEPLYYRLDPRRPMTWGHISGGRAHDRRLRLTPAHSRGRSCSCLICGHADQRGMGAGCHVWPHNQVHCAL